MIGLNFKPKTKIVFHSYFLWFFWSFGYFNSIRCRQSMFSSNGKPSDMRNLLFCSIWMTFVFERIDRDEIVCIQNRQRQCESESVSPPSTHMHQVERRNQLWRQFFNLKFCAKHWQTKTKYQFVSMTSKLNEIFQYISTDNRLFTFKHGQIAIASIIRVASISAQVIGYDLFEHHILNPKNFISYFQTLQKRFSWFF